MQTQKHISKNREIIEKEFPNLFHIAMNATNVS